jgi:hypothetical protein
MSSPLHTVAGRTLLGLLLTSAAVPIALAVRPAADPCVAWWRFQHGVTNHPAADHQVIEDSSGNDLHGLAFGGPRFRRVKLPGSSLALEFDGGEHQRVFVPDDEAFELTGGLTLEAYVKVERRPGFASQIVFRGDARGGLDPWFLRLCDDGRVVFVVTNDRNEASEVKSPDPLPLQTWLHVAGTLDDATGEQLLFVDGMEVARTRTAIRPFAVLGGEAPGIGIGNLAYGGNQGFCGAIDEVRITAKALAPAQLLPPPGQRRAPAAATARNDAGR